MEPVLKRSRIAATACGSQESAIEVHGGMISVLLVNSYDAREMYAEYLRAHQVAVEDVAVPEEALVTLTAFAPDVIVTDFTFQGSPLDGPAFVRLLRGQPEFQRTPVIVVSGYVRAEDRQEARDAGADRFLLSPCLPSDLLTEIGETVACRRRGERIPWNSPPASTATNPPSSDRRIRPSITAGAPSSFADATPQAARIEPPRAK
jgi:CheY-like chemotaxis protein